MGNTPKKLCISEIDSEDGNDLKLSYGASKVQGWRPYQEDMFLCLPLFDINSSLFGVFDGHNGPEVAKFSVKYQPSILLKNSNYQKGLIELGLTESFQTLDHMILEKRFSTELSQWKNSDNNRIPGVHSGSTAVVALIKNDKVFVANLGDSRCILSQYGEPFPMTVDHKPSDPEEMKRIIKAGGSVFKNRINNRINISRTLGDHRYKLNKSLSPIEQMIIALPDIKCETLKRYDFQFMLMISDGVYGSITSQDLVEFVANQTKIENKLSIITENILKRILPQNIPPGSSGSDNMCIIIVKFDNKKVNIPVTSIPRIIGLNANLLKVIESKTGAKIVFDVKLDGNDEIIGSAQSLIENLIQTDKKGKPSNQLVKTDRVNTAVDLIDEILNPKESNDELKNHVAQTIKALQKTIYKK